ncbi:MAG: hypothetical protein O6943_13125 [Bacteroidetes bacterium]|nr:hypothetical protein [Bacteroidota bacterium]
MILEHRTINLFEKKVFETAVVTPPFRSINKLDNEACFLYVLEGGNDHYSEEGHIKYDKDEGVLMKCGNFMFNVNPDKDTGRGEFNYVQENSDWVIS